MPQLPRNWRSLPASPWAKINLTDFPVYQDLRRYRSLRKREDTPVGGYGVMSVRVDKP